MVVYVCHCMIFWTASDSLRGGNAEESVVDEAKGRCVRMRRMFPRAQESSVYCVEQRLVGLTKECP